MLIQRKVIKTKMINMKVTEEQKQIIDKMAKDRGMKLTVLILSLLENELMNPVFKVKNKEEKNK